MIKVNFEETIRKNKLVANNGHIFNTLFLYFFAGIMAYFIYALRPGIKYELYNIAYNFILIPVAAIIMGYILYKKTIENRLFYIASPYNIEKTKNIVLAYFYKEKWNIEYNEGHYMIATNSFDLFGEMQATVIHSEGSVLLNVIRSRGGKNYGAPLYFDDTATRNGIAWAISNDGKPEEGYVYKD